MLKFEIKVMKAFKSVGLDGFSELKAYGRYQSKPFLIMNRFAATLQDIMDSRKSVFSLKTVIQIGI